MTETHAFSNPRPAIALTKDREAQAQSLLDSHLLGVRLVDLRRRIQFGEDEITSNFAIFRPANPIGSRVFIHGKDMFSKPAADFYFSGSANAGHMPYELFGDKAKNKIRRALSPESLYERIDDYTAPTNDVENIKLEVLQHGLNIDPQTITAENAYKIHKQVNKHRENEGTDLSKSGARHRNLSDNDFAAKKNDLRKFTLDMVSDTFLLLRTTHASVKLAHHYKQKLLSHLEAHGWDPEIVHNFAAGTTLGIAKEFPDLETLIKAGLEKRVEEYVRTIAASMSNPYDPEIEAKEKEAARQLAKHMQPRVLNNALKTNTTIILTNEDDMRQFPDILGYTGEAWQGAAGVYLGASPLQRNKPTVNNFIIIGAGNINDTFNPRSIRKYGRHELEHHRDLTQDVDFTNTYKDKIPKAINADFTHFEHICAVVKKGLNEQPLTKTERNALIHIFAGMRTLTPEEQENIATGMNKEKDEIFYKIRTQLSEIRYRASAFFPESEDTRSPHYNTNSAQYTEIPAIMAELSAVYGSATTRALFPNLYTMYRKHRLGNEGLRDDRQGMCR